MNLSNLEPSEHELAGADSTEPCAGRRVLVAEDSPITQDLLKLLLTQRGHQVDIVTDGLQALEALRRTDYHVALLDFHLPGMDGLQVASILRREAGDRPLPRLIAITADVEGLLAHGGGCENFDRVIPKPLDIYQVSQVVEEKAVSTPELLASQRVVLPISADVKPTVSSPFEQLGFNFLSWPGDFESGRLSARAMQASLGDPRFDGILLHVPVTLDDLVVLWSAKALYALPIIDLTGKAARIADLDGSKLNASDDEQLGRLIREFHDRRTHLHREILFSSDLSEQLLGRLFVSRRDLIPKYNPSSRSLVSYNVSLSPAVVMREAERLCEEGMLKRKFYDRFHVCPRCDSFRHHVREECSDCRSSELKEEQYLHHFRCAYQGPENEFRQDDLLVCPKCRYELTHFGFDYDRPGSMVVCGKCGKAASEPVVGFVCLDCGSHSDSDVMATRDFSSYSLSDDGLAFAEHGQSLLGAARQALRFGDLPVDLVVALNAAAKTFNDEQVPFTLVNIFYLNERVVVADHGARAFARARDLFIENLRGSLESDSLVAKGQAHDFVLLPGLDNEKGRIAFELLKVRAESPLRHDLGIEFKVFGPEAFS